jgi:hypothetical protein
MAQRRCQCCAEGRAEHVRFRSKAWVAAEQVDTDNAAGQQALLTEGIELSRCQVIQMVARIAECIHEDDVVAVRRLPEVLLCIGDVETLPLIEGHSEVRGGNHLKRRIDIDIIDNDVGEMRVERQ